MSLELAKSLVEIEAIKFNFEEGFTYASGRNGQFIAILEKLSDTPL